MTDPSFLSPLSCSPSSTFSSTIELTATTPAEKDDALSLRPLSLHSRGKSTIDPNRHHGKKWVLYTSHAVAQMSEQLWQFAFLIILTTLADPRPQGKEEDPDAVAPTSAALGLVSLYGFFTGLAIVLSGPYLGRALDRAAAASSSALTLPPWRSGSEDDDSPSDQETTPHSDHEARWRLLQGWLWVEGFAVMVANTAAYLALQEAASKSTSPTMMIMLMMVGSGVAQVFDRGILLALERDWIVVLSRVWALNDHQEPAEPSKESEEEAGAIIASSTQVKLVNRLDNRMGYREEQDCTLPGDEDGENGSDLRLERQRLTTAATTTVAAEPQLSSPSSSRRDHAQHQLLAHLNVTMRQIDLTCKIVAPVLAGSLVHALTNITTEVSTPGLTPAAMQGPCLLVGLINIVALMTEYVCCRYLFYHAIWKVTPRWSQQQGAYGVITQAEARDDQALHHRHHPQEQQGQESRSMEDSSSDGEQNNSKADSAFQSFKSRDGETNPGKAKEETDDDEEWHRNLAILPATSRSSWQIYRAQRSCGSGVALALLYLNALTFGNGIVTAYLLSQNMPLSTIGVWRGVAAAIGLVGTFAFSWSMHRLSLEGTASWSIFYDFSCLLVGGVAFWSGHRERMTVGAQASSLNVMLLAMCCSRVGLWVYDLAVTQIQQEQVPDNVRGMVGGVQQSLNSLFELLSFGMGLVFRQDDETAFHAFVVVAVCSVGLAALIHVCSHYAWQGRHCDNGQL